VWPQKLDIDLFFGGGQKLQKQGYTTIVPKETY